jgi:hypothetical protein
LASCSCLDRTLGLDPVSLTLIKDGDHRLSREEDLARIEAAIEEMG